MKKFLSGLVLAGLIVSCSNNNKSGNEAGKKDMSMSAAESKQERNKKVIMANMEAAAKGDAETMLKDVAASFTEYFDGTIPPVTSRDSLKMMLQSFFTSIEGFKPSGIMYLADGDYVAAYANWSGMFKKDFMGVKATGKMVNYPDVDIFKLNEEGKITEHRSVQNTGAALMSSGMMK